MRVWQEEQLGCRVWAKSRIISCIELRGPDRQMYYQHVAWSASCIRGQPYSNAEAANRRAKATSSVSCQRCGGAGRCSVGKRM